MKITIHTDVSARPVLAVIRGCRDEDLGNLPSSAELGFPVLAIPDDIEIEFD